MSTVRFQEVSAEQAQGGAPASIDRPTLFKEVSDALDADLFLYSGNIERNLASIFLNEADRPTRRRNAALILCTTGGDADAAYIIARYLKNNYEKFFLFVFGWCKSAGTLIALGADEIIMSVRGELGPLDVQLLKTDELLFRSSGLDIAAAIKSLSDQAFEIFEKHFLEIIRRGGGAITTHTAAEIASSLSVGLVSPITDQIDPLRVGEVERAINIAYEYGIRLNNNPDRVTSLIKNYPSHSFVIDYKEAGELFQNVRTPNEIEETLERVLRSFEGETGQLCISRPNEEGLIGYLKPKQENTNEPQQNTDGGDQQTSPPTKPTSGIRTNGGNNKAGRKDESERPLRPEQVAQEVKGATSQGGREQ
ncbi:MAG TPA: hypothetical protein VM911_12635 [Pyrinomonadaceae bacterium]|jgi:hypothetical protein|nr:hypothetical protein [Pyrinomonadaceae bacterium]